MAKMPTPEELLAATPTSFPKEGWMDTKPDFHPGSFCYPAKTEILKGLGFENAHDWAPDSEDWELPENSVISIEEYLDRRKDRKKETDKKQNEDILPFEIYLSSSLSWS